jgi:hypothetical protein
MGRRALNDSGHIIDQQVALFHQRERGERNVADVVRAAWVALRDRRAAVTRLLSIRAGAGQRQVRSKSAAPWTIERIAPAAIRPWRRSRGR